MAQPVDIPDVAWWFRITNNADRYLDQQRECYAYPQGFYEDSDERTRRGERWNAALKEYKRWVLEAWEKHQAWCNEQGLVFGKDYVLPTIIEELLAKNESVSGVTRG